MRSLQPLVLLALTACGSDAANDLLNPTEPDVGPAMVEVEAAPETAIKDLDAAGRDAVCAAWFRAVQRQVPARTLCVFPGVAATGADPDQSAADAVSSCADSVEICTRAVLIGEAQAPDLPTGACFLAQPTEDCASTVADLQPCLDSMADVAVGQIRALFTCDLAALKDAPIPEVTAPAVADVQPCGQVTLDCPGLFGADADAEADAGVGE